MLGYKGPAQPSPTLGDALNAGYGYLEVRCLGCDTHQTVALDIVRRPKATPIHELERYMRCKDCSAVRGYPFKRSHLVALRQTKISASILVEGDDDLRKLPLSMRKANLERLLARRPEGIFVSPFEPATRFFTYPQTRKTKAPASATGAFFCPKAFHRLGLPPTSIVPVGDFWSPHQ